LGEINESQLFKDFLKKEEITFVVYLGPDPKTGLLRFVTTSNEGFIKWNEIDLKNNKFTCKKSLFVCNSGISVACKLSGEQSFALAGKNNDIYIFSFQTGTCINEFNAHDDYINTLLFHDAKLVSGSMDQAVKIWDLKQQYYEDDPTVIYDHDDEVIAADIRPSDSMLVTMDI
jgi:WD40 repeat protein